MPCSAKKSNRTRNTNIFINFDSTGNFFGLTEFFRDKNTMNTRVLKTAVCYLLSFPIKSLKIKCCTNQFLTKFFQMIF